MYLVAETTLYILTLKNDTWRAMPLTTVTVISSITRMTDGLAAILTVPHGNI